MKPIRRLKINEDGAAIVEFAIVLPIFLILVFGIIEFGIIMYNKAMITNASREGARFGILYADPPPATTEEIDALKSSVKEKVADKLGTDVANLDKSILISLGSSPNIVTSVAFIPDDSTREYLEVTVEYQYGFLIMHLLWKLIPGLQESVGNLNLTGTTTMRMEYQES